MSHSIRVSATHPRVEKKLKRRKIIEGAVNQVEEGLAVRLAEMVDQPGKVFLHIGQQ